MNNEENDVSPQMAELEGLMREVRLVFYQVRRALLAQGISENSKSGVFSLLLELYQQGPRSIPMLLEDRAVSRQYLQKLANYLVAEGLVEFIDNPRHKRSKLIQLTDEGRESLTSRRSKYHAYLSSVPLELSQADLQTSAQTLRTIRQVLKTETDN